MDSSIDRKMLGKIGVVLGLLVFMGCQGNPEVNTALPGSSGNSTQSIPQNGNPSGATYSSTDFYVALNGTPGQPELLHADPNLDGGSWTTPCKISGGTTNTDLFCVAELEEGDIYTNGLQFMYNAPSTCAYLVVRPYYYFQFQPGLGPTAVTINENEITGVTTISSTGGSYAVNTGALLNGTTPVCAADYSGELPVPGPNCCEGQYALTTVITSAGPVVTTTVTQGSWGGLAGNCLTGPGVDLATEKDYENYPFSPVYTLAGNNFASTMTVASPMSKVFASNVYASNFFSTGATPYSYQGPAGSPDSVWPTAMQAPTGTGFRDANAYYDFECRDHAFDYVNRIRVFVRSWSQDSQYAIEGNPGAFGAQGAPFDYHDIADFEDWISGPGGVGFGSTYPQHGN